MKIPEKAPNWREIYKNLSSAKHIEVSIGLRGKVDKVNSEYLYWDKVKYLSVGEDVKPEEFWAIIKNTRRGSIQGLPFTDIKHHIFTYWMPSTSQKYLHLIDRGMEKVLKGQTAKEYQLRSIMEEAIASSQIEGAATTRAVAKEMLRSGRKARDYGEKMILNNYKTIIKLKEFTDQPLSAEIIKAIHLNITENTLEDPLWEGTFRDDENAKEEDKMKVYAPDKTILHTPPTSSEIESRVNFMCQFANEEDENNFIHPVIKAIILHFWLAYVHPFMDGNGRTARALFYWYMLRHDYPLIEYLSISSVINKKRTQYLKAFLYSEMDENDLTYFIKFHLNAIQEALDEVVEYIKRKKREAALVDHLYAKFPTLNHRQWPIVISALEKPTETYTIEKHMNTHGTARQTARTDLLELNELGLLDMRKEGRRFVFIPVADLAEKLKPQKPQPAG
jgi:Fic family protein